MSTTTEPTLSVVMPVYNVEAFVSDAISSVLKQTYTNFELLIINDCSPDNSINICKRFKDPRIKIIHHSRNRGLAGARNTGIRNAQGKFIAFLDSDDLWHPDKLLRHVQHLTENPDIGLSFSRSAFIDTNGKPNHCYQMPRLKNIDAGYIFCRNPVGNGSSPVIRRETLEAIAFDHLHENTIERCYFDPNLRRSEDIECFLRIALTTCWRVEGIPEPLTLYRLNAEGLSAQLYKQLESWEKVAEKTRSYAPAFSQQWEKTARAFQLRYLARQAIRLKDGSTAVKMTHQALKNHKLMIFQEPTRTITTICAAYLLRCLPSFYKRIEHHASMLIGIMQKKRIQQDLS
ncbi:glycosyltransferase family 2 protein [Zooshikella ganghwensis]|uniref:Glycosyltransferase family 2 protein n=1 Tax=Zooshikella ganghwensis TaxID=202772 RepID=A0A4P9VS10_9GAMM|nr:glycosyltransferase family 2 protein [Zooshikella ganghwensis]RDH44962.1 glycosyltransferase family 2 protein [Zooshikella ganghwensis]